MPTEQEVELPLGDGRMRAALALPDGGEGLWPGVVVIHELLGLNVDMRRIARRFAASGYAALAPDLFDGLGPKPICMLRTVLAYRRGGGRALGAIEAARDWLGARAQVDAARLGVAGFCMGGGFALLLGLRPGVRAAAAFYGDVPQHAEDLRGVCPVVAGYGAQDRIYGARGKLLEDHLRSLGVPHDVKTYGDAGHSFMSQYQGATALLGGMGPLRARHVAGPAEDSWSRMLAFFGEHLGAGSSAPGENPGSPE